MSLIGSIKGLGGSTSVAVSSGSFRGGDFWMFGENGTPDRHFTFSGTNSALKAYECCPPVSAIINRKAQAYINGKTWILNSKDKVAEGTIATKIKRLLKNPNRLQTWKQFEAQAYIYQQVFGFTIILPIKPKGFPNYDSEALWNIPPFMVDIKETEKLFYQEDGKGVISKIVLNYKGTRHELPIDDVFIMKDFTPSMNSLVIPASRLQANEMPVNNIIGTYESRNVLINYRGALGILSHDPGSGQYGSLPLDPADKESLQKDFMRYGLKQSQWQFIITSAALKWQQMGVPTKDLMLFEEIDDDIMRICDSYGYPFRLISTNKGSGLNGNEVKEFKVTLYQDTIIPEAENIYEQWTQFFGLDELNLRLDKDYNHLSVLQKDQVLAAQARKERNQALLIEWENNLITRNQWRVMNGDDPVQGDDVYYRDVRAAENPAPVQQPNNSSQQNNDDEQ